MAEIRPVSALFARVTGLGPDDAGALQAHHVLSRQFQDILRAHGGPAGELFFDDKGLVCFAAFGSPGTFHRDDPHRAIDAAHAIRAAARDLGFGAAVGLATGDAFIRVVGNGRHRQVMVLGQTVNRAARLMTEAPEGVLCDAPTERAARATFAFERRGTVQLLGLSDVAPVFAPLQRRRVAPSATGLIGREAELAFLKAAHSETLAGANRLVVVLGEPGIGKTTLVNAFADDLAANGLVVPVVRAERDDRRTSMLAWRRVLEALVAMPADSDGKRVYEAIASRLRGHDDLTARLPLLADMLSTEAAQTGRTRHLEGAHRADATMRLLGEVIALMAPKPLALVLEDSQWLDSASWRLVEWVLGSFTSLLVVLCARSGEIPEELTSLLQRAEKVHVDAELEPGDLARFCRTLELMELDAGSIRLLVARTLGSVPPDDEITRRVAALAGGNPLFAEEIALSLRSEGLIAVRDGYWRSIRPLEEMAFFEGVEKVIRERVDHLDLAAQNVLRAAAVIGRTFGIEALEALAGQTVAEAVDTLARTQMIRPGAETGLCEFRHDQIRDVVYSAIPSDLRQRLHGALARWIEAARTRAPGADLALLVQHFEAAGAFDEAVKYADTAASNALQIGAFREVESFIGICLEHEPPPQKWSSADRLRSVRWRRQLAEAQYSRGDIRAQGIAIRKALDAAGHTVPNRSAAILLRIVARAGILLWRNSFPRAPVVPEPTESVRRESEIARCLSQAATVDYFELRFVRGMCNLLGAVVHAERTGASAETALASAQLACGLGMMHWRAASRRLMARAEEVAVALGDPSIHSHVCSLDALWHLGLCEWAEVDRRLDQAQTLALRSADQLRWCNAQGMRFWSQYYRGEWSALEDTALALLTRAQNAGNLQQEIWALRCKALCVLHMDRPREAIDLLRLITAAMPGSVDLAAQISANGALALALSRIGKHAASFDAVASTVELLERVRRPSSHSIIVGISGALEVLLRGRDAGIADQFDDWVGWQKRALDELRRYCRVFPVGQAQLGLWTGLDHWVEGRRDRAMAVWRRALADARALSLRKDESLIAAEIRRREEVRA